MKSILCVILTVAVWLSSTARTIAADTVLITRVSNQNFVDGVPAETDVDVTYSLQSQPEGVLLVGFNELHPDECFPARRIPIVQGAGVLTVRMKVNPRIWSGTVKFYAKAMIECTADAGAERWLAAVDQRVVPVGTGPASTENGAKNAKPKESFIDGITILSISPDRLGAGQQARISVRVRYELLSRDHGEINLGINQGAGNGYKIVASKVVEIGTGEITIEAPVSAMKTGELPLMKVFVNLSEYPHRTPWSPLANASGEIAVE